MLKRLFNPYDRMLKRAARKGARRVLLCWNRGLGDIPLGVFGLVHRIREFIPEAEVCIVTRANLEDGFRMLPGITLFVDPTWERWKPFDIDATLRTFGEARERFDLIVEKADLKHWLKRQIGRLTPRLEWNPAWDRYAERFSFPTKPRTIAVHLHTETGYALWRNWPVEHWRALFAHLEKEEDTQLLLFGVTREHVFPQSNIIDLRGKTSLYEMLALIKNRCTHLIAIDGGVLAMCYYLDCAFPLHVVTLWANREHGILRQNVRSPNPQLVHTPVVAPRNDLRTLSVERVLDTLSKI